MAEVPGMGGESEPGSVLGTESESGSVWLRYQGWGRVEGKRASAVEWETVLLFLRCRAQEPHRVTKYAREGSRP